MAENRSWASSGGKLKYVSEPGCSPIPLKVFAFLNRGIILSFLHGELSF